MTRRILAGLAAAALALTGLTACTDNGSGYDTMCVNPLTQLRMADYYCLVGNPYYQPGWVYYVPYGYSAPGYGHRVSHYSANSYKRPKGATIHTGGVPASGGKAVNLTKTGSTTRRTGGGVTKPRSVYKPPSVRIGKR